MLLTRWLDRNTANPRRGSKQPSPRRVAGLLPRPIGAMGADMRAALAQRQQLIEQHAQQLTLTDLEAGAAWTKRLGTPSRDNQASWRRLATTIRLYRERYEVTGPTPLGTPDQVNGLEQAYEYRAARGAYDRAKLITSQQRTRPIGRTSVSIDRGHSIDP